MKKKIIQIAVATAALGETYLYGLDTEGNVYIQNYSEERDKYIWKLEINNSDKEH